MWVSQPACSLGQDDSLGPWAGGDCRGAFDLTLLFEKGGIRCSASICLVALNAALLVLWVVTPSDVSPRTRATIPTAVLSLIASFGVGLLSPLSPELSLRPSFVLSTYLFLSVLLNTARARTLWMLGSKRTIPAKRRILVLRHRGYSKEFTSGTFGRSIFFWMTSLFVNGYRNTLRLDDLCPLVPKLLLPDKTVPSARFSTWLCTFAGLVSVPIVPKLFHITFGYAKPFLIDEAYVLVYIGIAVSSGQHDWRNQHAASITRGSTTALVYRKALRLDLFSPNVSTSGALTLVGPLAKGITHRHEVWGGLLEIGIGIYLIYRQLEAACACPLPSYLWLKISRLNNVVFSVMQKLRGTELEMSTKFRVLLGVSMMMFSSRRGDILTLQKAFTAYSLLTLVSQPLVGIVMGLFILAFAFTSFHKMQDFLDRNERNDNRLIEGKNDTARRPDIAKNGIDSIKGTFSWPGDSKSGLYFGSGACRVRKVHTSQGSLLGKLSSFNAIRTNLGGISYCGQTAWIPNDTVRNTIVGFTAFDQSWYQSVLRACALDQDIPEWPQGENTAADSKGSSMSGGQEHRLALARALYAREKMLLLDDVFNRIDFGTEDVVFNGLFGSDGLLGDTDTTVVLTSSDSRRLSFAEKVVVLSVDGQIIDNAITGRPAGDQYLGKETTELNNLSKAAPLRAGNYNDRSPTTLLGVVEDQADAASTGRLGEVQLLRQSSWMVQPECLCQRRGCVHSFPDIWLKWWADSTETRPKQDLGKWLVLLGMWQLFIVIISRSGVYFHGALLDTTSRAPMSFHSSIDSGDTLWSYFGAAFGVARFIMISVSSGYMAVILPLLIPIFYAVRLLGIEHKAPLYSQLMETLEDLATIGAFSYLITCLQRWLTFSIDMVIAAIAIVLIVLVTALREQIGSGCIVKAIVTSWELHPSGPVLKGVNLSIQPGQKERLCDVYDLKRNGRSSLTLCLLRMMDLDAGSITIDGVDISTLPHEHVHSKLVAVPQESYIFDGTVRLSLDPTETDPDSEVVTVLEKVQLGAKTGEAQLLVLVRVMLRKGKVLTLDEISSSLDEDSNRVADEVLWTWFHDWIIIVIAHELESIPKFDRVVVVDAGVVVEYDEPQRLIGRASPFKAFHEQPPRPIS
ncbi:P-loop containing nucleoside triphosphate hydrolase protein [Colletotrichum falcatum]|nr:P-loop containing nucleoside triphosphate hydrolase protein [Colletotrichum falcatum]